MARTALQVSQNLLLSSNDFSTGNWNRRGTFAVTLNAAANPVDGAVTAQRIDGMSITGAPNDCYQYRGADYGAIKGQPYTISFWIKRISTTGVVNVGNPSNSNLYGWIKVDLSLIGDGWVRVVSGADQPGVQTYRPFIISTVGASGDGVIIWSDEVASKSVYMYGLQMSHTRGEVAFYPPTTGAVYNPGVPRNKIDGQNLLAGTSTLSSGTYWDYHGASVTVVDNQVNNPLTGTQTAATVTATAGGSYHYFGISTTPYQAGRPYTYSFFVQRNNNDWIFFTFPLDANLSYFNTATGLFGTVNGSVTSYSAVSYGNGWYRLILTATPTSNGNGLGIGLANGNGGGNFSAAGTEKVNVYLPQLTYGNNPGQPVLTGASANTSPIRNKVVTEQNLILNSSDYTQSNWTKRGTVTITANATANPINGAVDAQLVSAVSTPNVNDLSAPRAVALESDMVRQPFTLSFWIKRSSTSGTVYVLHSVNGNLGQMSINLASIGSGWVKITTGIDQTGVTTTLPFLVYTTGVGGDGIQFYASGSVDFYLYGVQYSVGKGPVAYVPTTSSVVGAGNKISTPRLKPVTRQNLFNYSEDFTNWSFAALTSANVGTTAGPFAGTFATELVGTAADTRHYLYKALASQVFPAGNPTMSAWLKAGNVSWAYLAMNGGGAACWFNLATGTVGTNGGGGSGRNPRIQSYGNGWYRCSLSLNCGRGELVSAPQQWIAAASGDADLDYLSTGSGADIYVYGAQMVKANHAGEYTYTNGTAIDTGNIRNLASYS